MDDGDGFSEPPESVEPQISERDAEICRLYETMSAERLAAKFGLSEAGIRFVIKKHGAPKKKRGRVGKVFEAEAYDSDHVKIGQNFLFHCTFKLKLTVAETADILGWSPQKVSLIGKGHHNLTLTDMKAMAGLMTISVSALLKDV